MDQVLQETCTSEYYTKTAAHFSTRPPHCKSSVYECVCVPTVQTHTLMVFLQTLVVLVRCGSQRLYYYFWRNCNNSVAVILAIKVNVCYLTCSRRWF